MSFSWPAPRRGAGHLQRNRQPHGHLRNHLVGADAWRKKSSQVSENLAAIEDFCSRLEVLSYGSKAAQHDGAIRAGLERLGRPIGVNDLHIAAHARSEGLVMVTNNVGEFARVPALQVENWLSTSK